MTLTEAGTPVVDPRFGIVTAIEPRVLHPGLPSALSVAAAPLAGLPVGAATPGGAAWFSPSQARAAALGEAVERYAALAPRPVRRASANELAAAAVPHLDPVALALHSRAETERAGFPFAVPNRDRTIAWSAAGGRDGVPVLVPTAHVALGLVADEPATHVPVNAGIAAARGPCGARDARLAALEEVLERDAVITAWAWDVRWPRLATPPWLSAVFGGERAGYDLAVHAVPNRWGLPVSAVLVTRRDGGALGLGTALRPTRGAAVAKAAAEAVVSVHAAHEIDAESNAGAWAGTALRAWRADRRYCEDYRSDWRDVTDVFCHVQLYLDPRMRRAALDRLAGGRPAPASWAPAEEVAGRFAYDEVVRRHGGEAYGVELTTPDLARAGWAVARCVVPGARSSAPAAFAQLGADPPEGLAEPTCLLPLPHA